MDVRAFRKLLCTQIFPLSSPFKLILLEATQREVMDSTEPTLFSMKVSSGVCLLREDGQNDQAMDRQGSRGGLVWRITQDTHIGRL